MQRLQQESRARCIERWLAAKVSEEVAEEFADNSTIGNIPLDVELIPTKIFIITGAMGAGKSLLAERLFQNIIERSVQDTDAPVPVYLESWQWRDSRPLQKAVEDVAKEIDDPKIQGAIVIINAADENVSSANELLSEARFLVRAWPNTTVVITSRSLRTLDEAQEIIQVPVPELTVAQTCTLISRLSGQIITEYTVSKWFPSLQSVIKLPLFALLVADYLKSQNIRVPQSTGELLNNLIERSLLQETVDQESTNQLLQNLAILCIQYGGNPVHFTELVSSRAELQPILASRLVIERHGKIGFALAILNEWFATQSLVGGNPDPEQLVQDVEQLYSWRYSLIMAIATSGYEQVSKFLTPIVKAHPAFAAEIVSEALASRFIDMPPLPWKICGRRIREAMQGWVNGINQDSCQLLSQFIAPVSENSSVLPIGIRSEQSKLIVGWYQGNEDIDDVVELPVLLQVRDFLSIRSVERSFFYRESASIRWLGPQPTWAWLWTLDELVACLSKLLQKRGLPINYGLLACESLWKLALSVLSCSRRTSFCYFNPHKAIPLDVLEAVLCEFDPNPSIQSFSFNGVVTILRKDLDHLKMKVAELRTLGKTQLDPPWGNPNSYSVEDFPWKCYTTEQINTYAEHVYLEALNAYQYTVNTWFTKFAHTLKLSVLMPVHLVGSLVLSSSGSEPSLYSYFEALPYGESNKVSFSIMENSQAQKEFFNLDIRERVDNQRHSLRFGKASIIGNTAFQHSGLRIFESTSATELVYSWLWDDLKQVSWVKGFLGSPPR